MVSHENSNTFEFILNIGIEVLKHYQTTKISVDSASDLIKQTSGDLYSMIAFLKFKSL